MPTTSIGPHMTWAGMASAGVLIVAIAVAVGTLVQSQISTVDRRIDQERSDRQAADSRVQKEIDDVNATLVRHRGEFVETGTFQQFEKRFDEIDYRVKELGTTRPTTGQLEQIGIAAKDQINKLEERVRSLEDNLRTRKTLP